MITLVALLFISAAPDVSVSFEGPWPNEERDEVWRSLRVTLQRRGYSLEPPGIREGLEGKGPRLRILREGSATRVSATSDQRELTRILETQGADLALDIAIVADELLRVLKSAGATNTRKANPSPKIKVQAPAEQEHHRGTWLSLTGGVTSDVGRVLLSGGSLEIRRELASVSLGGEVGVRTFTALQVGSVRGFLPHLGIKIGVEPWSALDFALSLRGIAGHLRIDDSSINEGRWAGLFSTQLSAEWRFLRTRHRDLGVRAGAEAMWVRPDLQLDDQLVFRFPVVLAGVDLVLRQQL